MEKKIKLPPKRRALRAVEETDKAANKAKAFFKDWKQLKQAAADAEKKLHLQSLPSSFFIEATDKEASLLYAWVKANGFFINEDYFQLCIKSHTDSKNKRILAFCHPNIKNVFKGVELVKIERLDLELVAKGLFGSFWKSGKMLLELKGFQRANHQVVLQGSKRVGRIKIEAYEFFTTAKFSEILNINKPNLEWAIYEKKKYGKQKSTNAAASKHNANRAASTDAK